MSVKLISVTPDAEKMMAYVARVSNPNNQENPNYAKLLGYCIKHNHWSVFEQAFMTLELETTRGVAAQVLRHRSFTYREFSQRVLMSKCRFLLYQNRRRRFSAGEISQRFFALKRNPQEKIEIFFELFS